LQLKEELRKDSELKVDADYANTVMQEQGKELIRLREEKESMKVKFDRECETMRNAAVTAVEAAQEELQMRRNKQYTLLAKLQSVETDLNDSLQKVNDQTFQIEVLEERCAEQEKRLYEVKQWRDAADSNAEARRLEAEKKWKDALDSLEQEKAANADMKIQLEEMAGKIIKLVAVIDAEKATVEDKNAALGERDKDINKLHDRIERLLEEVSVQGRAKQKAQMKARVLEEQLTAFQKDSRSKAAGVALQKIIGDESQWKDVEKEKGKRKEQQLQTMVRNEIVLRSSLTQRLFDIEARMALKANHQTDNNTKAKNIDFSFCSITDDDLEKMLSIPSVLALRSLIRCPWEQSSERMIEGDETWDEKRKGGEHCLSLDLRGNSLTDRAIEIIQSYLLADLSSPPMKQSIDTSKLHFSCINMRGNFVSFDSLRELSSTLRNDNCRAMYNFSHVKVVTSGAIECFDSGINGHKNSASMQAESAPLFVIDASEQISKEGGASSSGLCPFMIIFISLLFCASKM
jgi:hypothetical protein